MKNLILLLTPTLLSGITPYSFASQCMETPPGKSGFGNALLFDGLQSIVEVPDSSSLRFGTNNISIAVWIRPRQGSSGWRTIVSKFPHPGHIPYGDLYFVLVDDQVFVRLVGADYDVNLFLPTTVESGVWTHLVMTYDGSELAFFKNGGELVRLPVAFGDLELTGNSNPLYLGYNLLWPNEVFDGHIDEVHLFDRAISTVEVWQLHAGPGAIGDEIAYYNNDTLSPHPSQPDASVLTDQSVFGNHGYANLPACPDTVQVVIDVKPGSDPNCFSLNGNGVIPVAILGSDSLDIAYIDQSGLLFGGMAVGVRGKKGPLCNAEYSNEDAYLDLVCHFEDDSENWSAGSEYASLIGTMLDDTSIEGSDAICVVP